MRQSLILVSYHFPPDASAGSIRTAALARLLSNIGWRVAVICPTPEVYPVKDDDLMSLVQGIEIRRTYSPPVYRVGNRHPASGESHKTRKPLHFLIRRTMGMLDAGVFVPDRMAAWLPWLIQALRKANSELRPSVVLCSGPPFSSFVGAVVSLRSSTTPLVLDYRDPWTVFPDWTFDESFRERRHLGIEVRLRLERRLESWVLSHTAGLSAVTPRLHALIREQLPTSNLKASTVVRNGVVSSKMYDALQSLHPRSPSHHHLLVHVGNFYGDYGAQPILAGLSWLARHNHRLYSTIRVHFYGSFRQQDLDFAKNSGLLDGISVFGPASYIDGLRATLGADGLLMCLPRCRNTECWIPMKTYVYLASGRPMLAVIPEGELSDYLSGKEQVIKCPPDDPENVGRGLAELVTTKQPGPRIVTDYSFDTVFHDLDILLQEVCSEKVR